MNEMNAKAGVVVRAIAGRDCGDYFVITAIEGRDVFLANGKSRKLSAPKRKNIKHLRLTTTEIALDEITDKKLRTTLREIAAGVTE